MGNKPSPTVEAVLVPAGPVDVVVMASMRADGTPDQTHGFIVIGPDAEAEADTDPTGP